MSNGLGVYKVYDVIFKKKNWIEVDVKEKGMVFYGEMNVLFQLIEEMINIVQKLLFIDQCELVDFFNLDIFCMQVSSSIFYQIFIWYLVQF